MARNPPPFFSLSVKAGATYITTLGKVIVVSCKKQSIPNEGSAIVVSYTVNGDPGEPKKQYEFKKWIWSITEDPQDPPAPPANPPVPDPLMDLPEDPPTPPAPPAPPNHPPTDPPPPPAPKKRGMLDWMDDLFDWLFS